MSNLGKFRIPFFMVDLSNFEAIVLPNVPLEVTSNKPINWAKGTIPGMPLNSMQFSSFGSQEISFDILLANRNPYWGNMHILKQFEKLRTPVEGLFALAFNEPNNSNPQVLFWYGTGNTLPLIYYVTGVSFNHQAFNSLGYPTITNISVSLVLKEDTNLYKAERISRMVLSLAGMADSVRRMVASFKGEKPY